jgi:hypothetical protein
LASTPRSYIGAFRMPIRGIEMRAVTAVAGAAAATAAAAFRWAASVGCGVVVAVGEADGDGVLEAVARTSDVATS